MLLGRSSKYEKRAKMIQELAAGQPIRRPFSDTVTLYGFLAIMLFLFVWLFSGALFWSLGVVAAIFAFCTALTWKVRQRMLRRGGMEL